MKDIRFRHLLLVVVGAFALLLVIAPRSLESRLADAVEDAYKSRFPSASAAALKLVRRKAVEYARALQGDARRADDDASLSTLAASVVPTLPSPNTADAEQRQLDKDDHIRRALEGSASEIRKLDIGSSQVDAKLGLSSFWDITGSELSNKITPVVAAAHSICSTKNPDIAFVNLEVYAPAKKDYDEFGKELPNQDPWAFIAELRVRCSDLQKFTESTVTKYGLYVADRYKGLVSWQMRELWQTQVEEEARRLRTLGG